ncbi:hypothetical protein TSAR_000926 [Trichomalopsis sarcophagae]|uniref:Secreted protein n=1 Tax=Trichomalopsis sarcophagae TaxID=543379 RepID=A0A232F3G6_9HYME|nr:hypothetical protein TSAR_000926 [Trichomalopsis sarcophagae]
MARDCRFSATGMTMRLLLALALCAAFCHDNLNPNRRAVKMQDCRMKFYFYPRDANEVNYLRFVEKKKKKEEEEANSGCYVIEFPNKRSVNIHRMVRRRRAENYVDICKYPIADKR